MHRNDSLWSTFLEFIVFMNFLIGSTLEMEKQIKINSKKLLHIFLSINNHETVNKINENKIFTNNNF